MRLLRLIVLLWIVLLLSNVVGAQDEIAALFLGREDSNLDGQINTGDTVGVFAVYDDGRSIRISPQDETVLSYRASPDLSQIAYITSEPTGLRLSLAAGRAVTNTWRLDDLSSALVERVDAQIWLSERDADDQSLIFSIDPATESQSRIVITGESVITTFASTGNYAIAYEETGQRVQVIALPTFDISEPVLPPLILGTPAWSPSDDRFAFVGADNAEGAGLSLYIVSAAGGEIQRIPLPAVASPQSAFISWGAGATHVSIKLTDSMQDPSVINPLHIADVAQNTLVTLQEATTYFDPISWSPDDQFLLINSNQTLPDGFVFGYQFYDVALGQLRTLDTLALANPTYFSWRPGTQDLWLLGTPIAQGQSGIMSLSTADDSLSVIVTTEGTALIGGALLWGGDTRLVVLATEQDPIAQLLGVGYALYRYDEGVGGLTRLSPTTIAPLPFGVQVR